MVFTHIYDNKCPYLLPSNDDAAVTSDVFELTVAVKNFSPKDILYGVAWDVNLSFFLLSFTIKKI